MKSKFWRDIFFFYLRFFPEHSGFTGQQRKGEAISLTHFNHVHPLQRHSDISRAITAESSPLHSSWQPDSNREPLVSESKSLTTKLHTLKKGSVQFIEQCTRLVYNLHTRKSFLKIVTLPKSSTNFIKKHPQ